MIEKNVDISIPLLWGQDHFTKNEWGHINYIVGPNGTGKTLLAEQLKNHFSNDGFTARYLSAERLVGLEKKNEGRFGGANLAKGFDISLFDDYKRRAEGHGLSSSGIIILKERLDIRIKIEALLSDIFGKTIRLAEQGGYLKPMMQNKASGNEYGLSESECHGLKELITLLTFLYDPAKNCIIFDEPELHLHPQYQSFFLEELRKVAGNPLEDPSKKVIFLITHSPYFIDIKSLSDLKSILVCGPGKVPTYISDLDDNDRYVLNRFLPRFNTHHKQFFFSPNPVFVEGYTDQQIISILFEKLGINIGASGSCVIDVGGKDELGVFYRLCQALKVDCRIIADLDALFRGRLRSVICEDDRANSYIQENGIGVNISAEIGDLESKLSLLADYIINNDFELDQIGSLKARLEGFSEEEVHKKRVSMLLGIINIGDILRNIFDGELLANFNLISGRLGQLLSAFKSTNTYIFPKGEIEHYYTQSEVDYLNINNKDAWFHSERDYLLEMHDAQQLRQEYGELLDVVSEAVPVVDLEIRKHITFEVFEWIHRVQTGIAKLEIKNEEDLKRSAKVNYTLYQQILNLESLIINEDLTFECIISINRSFIDEEIQITFNQETNAHSFEV
ncbi:AAA family ATPase [Marinobacter hydrocarbonoclasticus]|uniref:ATP-dependent nuclease n=1 Tax=Marinobacter nauticus TaxID=2743 RepID=UPI001A8F65D7|nr:TOPRIM nucleotidyl transferase/hydrolase domain-containing protein [Marinobacter nauticus]MBN8239970.1 AAA family ATPase [Marinobacter nauticus]